jgi:hypothetical protein
MARNLSSADLEALAWQVVALSQRKARLRKAYERLGCAAAAAIVATYALFGFPMPDAGWLGLVLIAALPLGIFFLVAGAVCEKIERTHEEACASKCGMSRPEFNDVRASREGALKLWAEGFARALADREELASATPPALDRQAPPRRRVRSL